MNRDINEKLKNFHGKYYNIGPWNSRDYECCRLCKTKNSTGKYGHWAQGLCRSCYRRLLVSHRFYNDLWLATNKNVSHKRRSIGKKEYKSKDFSKIKFDNNDIDTLLERYDFRCAYSGILLQNFDYKSRNSFQLEYIIIDSIPQLVPVSRVINCSKKGLTNPVLLEQWARKNNLLYPFNYISVKDYFDD